MCVAGAMRCVGDDGGDRCPALECCDCCDGEGGGEDGGIGLLLLLRDGETETLVVEAMLVARNGNQDVYGVKGNTNWSKLKRLQHVNSKRKHK